jgi:hypothetical protein
MAAFRNRDERTIGRVAAAVGHRVGGVVHREVARALAFVGGNLSRALGKLPWSCRFGLMSAAMAGFAISFAGFGGDWLAGGAELDEGHLRTLDEAGFLQTLGFFQGMAWAVAILGAAAAFAAFKRHRRTRAALKVAGVAFAFLLLLVLMVVVRAPAILYGVDPEAFSNYDRNFVWIAGVLLWLPWALLAAGFLVCLSLRSAREFYSEAPPEGEPLGDRIMKILKGEGRDPGLVAASYWASFAHFFVLLLLPVILARGCGWEKAYAIPKGSGNPVVQLIKIKKVKKKKKKKVVLNMDSPIIFYRPDLDESDVLRKIEVETLDTYVATSLKTGRLGKGGGARGGWPNGMENARVRFIRLEYSGGDWDQDMGVGADYNLLIKFHEFTGFNVAPRTESIGINRLRRFPKKRAPPFVFITGRGGIRASREEARTLRWYCLEEGGMIFADNGGGSFNSSFRGLMRRSFPELQWVDIASDDVLFRQPFVFPNGAPPLWHHSGRRAVGLKHNGRWIAFYHQGDLNDAWKTGHSGVTEGQAMQAYKLGVNIINYSFNQYMSIHFGD